MDWLSQQAKDMRSMLVAWAEINSGSYNHHGLARMFEVVEQAFAQLAGMHSRVKAEPSVSMDMRGLQQRFISGDILSIKKRPEADFKIILCGHMDTVFAADHPFQTVTEINNNCLNGPGVADMKGGLLVMLYALLAFEQSPHAKRLGWEVVINADEELGSPCSANYYTQVAKDYQMGLVYEPAMDDKGTLAGERKGSGKFTLSAKGRSAHAGRAFAQGRNAICLLAECITELHQLNDQRSSLTINVGKIAGGDALNAVPNWAVAKLDVRVTDNDDKSWLLDQMHGIIERYNQREGYHIQCDGGFGREPKLMTAGTLQLLNKVKSLAQVLGLELSWQASGGCCDGNNLAAEGLPVIDTLGVRGGSIHSSDEYILIDSLVERAQLSALLLMELAESR